jgi:hypothetical protein
MGIVGHVKTPCPAKGFAPKSVLLISKLCVRNIEATVTLTKRDDRNLMLS